MRYRKSRRSFKRRGRAGGRRRNFKRRGRSSRPLRIGYRF